MFYTRSEIASMVRVHPVTIGHWWQEGLMPQPKRVKRALRWDKQEIDQWIADGFPKVNAEQGVSNDTSSEPNTETAVEELEAC